MANQKLADAAVAGITNPNYEEAPGYCQRFAREVIEGVYGAKYSPNFQPSAKDTAYALLAAGLAMAADEAGTLQIGDVIYKTTTAGPFGHVGIYVDQSRIAENSSTSIGRVQGAKGFRTPAQWGTPQVVFRITDTSGNYTLYLSGVELTLMPVIDGASFCPVRVWAAALGVSVDWDLATQQVVLQGKNVNAPVKIINGTGYVAIDALVSFSNLTMQVDSAKLAVYVVKLNTLEPAAQPS